MQFAIKCETYVRLNRIVHRFKETEERDCLRSIYIERKNGTIIAVATNAMILAAEIIEMQPGPDASFYLTIDPVLLTQCHREGPLGGSLHLIYTPMLNHVAVKTTFGYQYTGNALMTFKSDITRKHWRDIVNTREKKKSAMVIEAQSLADLAAASPSGVLIFADDIDGSRPTVVRDLQVDGWLGMFMPVFHGTDGKRIVRAGAEYPEWAA